MYTVEIAIDPHHRPTEWRHLSDCADARAVERALHETHKSTSIMQRHPTRVLRGGIEYELYYPRVDHPDDCAPALRPYCPEY